MFQDQARQIGHSAIPPPAHDNHARKTSVCKRSRGTGVSPVPLFLAAPFIFPILVGEWVRTVRTIVMRRMLRLPVILIFTLVLLFSAGCALFQHVGQRSPEGLLVASLLKIHDVVEPPRGTPARTFEARFKVIEAEGVSQNIVGREFGVAVQPPDRLRLTLCIKDRNFRLGRDGQQLWVYSPEKKFCLLAQSGVARFKSSPDELDTTQLGALDLPLPRNRIGFLPHVIKVKRLPDESVGTNLCHVLVATRRPDSRLARKLPAGQLQFWLRQSDKLPLRISYDDNRGTRVRIEFEEIGFQAAWPDEKWQFAPGEGDRTETVALSHMTRFFSARWSLLNAKLPPLGPATGERRVVATEGTGRLEIMDGTRVLFLKGSPEEMGRQHGVLLRKDVQNTVSRVLYGLGVGASLAKGSWFFGEMDEAGQRLQPHMDERYSREMDAMADASGVTREEIRMANLFPELFHCSGFAIYGDATVGGRMYHGRILDYFRSQGLEQSAVVIVSQPDYGNAWVNIGYAGFIGSVTAMNEKHVAIGEMGGRGEGQWDGKPMAQLVREVMEKSDTIDEAVEIMRRGPRTCEYYYVISDAKTKRAIAIHATPTEFETVWAGESHPMIPEAIKDAALVSGGSRFTELIRRVKAGYGKFDADSARELMTRPVCMKSNIHSVLFAPDTLDFWVANADSRNPASHTRFTRYNLAELLQESPAR